MLVDPTVPSPRRRRSPLVRGLKILSRPAAIKRHLGAGGDTRTFLGAIARNPRRLGAIAPSSKAVARLAASVIPDVPGAVVVELGPGGGVISDVIHHRLPPNGRQLAVELSPDMVRHLERSRPWLEVIAGDAGGLSALLARAGVTKVDAVISSLPWGLLEESQQRRILNEISAVLVPDGTFSTITTLTVLPLRRFRSFRNLLDRSFDSVSVLGPVWFNIPPALVFTCVRKSAKE